MTDTNHPDNYRMSFGDHLEELRKRLLMGIIGVAIAAVLTLAYGKDLIQWLVVPLNNAQIKAGIPPVTVVPKPTDGFTIYLKVSLIGAAVLAAPWLAYQAWLFISAGLYAHERKVVYVLAPFSAIMTFLAVMFMYYILLPVSLAFLLMFTVNYGEPGGEDGSIFQGLIDSSGSWAGDDNTGKVTPDENPKINTNPDQEVDLSSTLGAVPQYEVDPEKPFRGQIWVNTKQNALKVRVDERIMVVQLSVSALVSPLINLSEYISFAMFLMLGIVVAFQLPVIMVIGGKAGIINPDFFAKQRKYVVFICFVAGAVLTPADPISMIVLAVPLWALFEIGLLGVRMVRPKPGDSDGSDGDSDAGGNSKGEVAQVE